MSEVTYKTLDLSFSNDRCPTYILWQDVPPHTCRNATTKTWVHLIWNSRQPQS